MQAMAPKIKHPVSTEKGNAKEQRRARAGTPARRQIVALQQTARSYSREFFEDGATCCMMAFTISRCGTIGGTEVSIDQHSVTKPVKLHNLYGDGVPNTPSRKCLPPCLTVRDRIQHGRKAGSIRLSSSLSLGMYVVGTCLYW